MASPLESAITLEDVFAMVTGKRVPLAPELAGYLSLEVAEKADAGGMLGDVDTRSVYIADEGTVALVRPRSAAAAEGDAEESIRGILQQLLDASGSSTPALTTVARRPRAGSLRALMEEIEAALIPVNRAAGRRALARLAREVKRVTHGVGRNAPSARAATGEPIARRTVDAPAMPTRPGRPAPPRAPARSEPEAAFGMPELPQAPAPKQHLPSEPPPLPPARAMFDNPSDVDSLLEQFSQSTTQTSEAVSQGLKDLVDVGKTALPPGVALRQQTPPPQRALPSEPPASAGTPDIDDLLALSEEAAPAEPLPPSVPSIPPIPPSAIAPSVRQPAFPQPSARQQDAPRRESSRPPASSNQPNLRDLPTHQSLPAAEWAKPKKKRTDYWIIIALLGVLATASAAVWLFKPGFISGRTSEKVAEEAAANEALRQKQLANQAVLSCHAAVDVTDVPAGAEVLLRVGQAPVDVPHLPVGARLEFVATAEGFAPKRVVVPADATWDSGPDGKPRIEVAAQLDHSNPKNTKGDPWPPGDPGSQVGGKGAPGTVHVVSSPRGAEVWMLAGLGPEALVEQLPCDQSVEVLVAGPTTFRKRLKAASADFVARPGEQSSKIVKLSAR